MVINFFAKLGNGWKYSMFLQYFKYILLCYTEMYIF